MVSNIWYAFFERPLWARLNYSKFSLGVVLSSFTNDWLVTTGFTVKRFLEGITYECVKHPCKN